MKKILNILVICSVYLMFCGKSCVSENERVTWQEEQVKVVKDSIRGEFEADFLTEEARYAAGIRAIQKLNDLADYVKIFSDITLDSIFRIKAGEMIGNEFITGNSKLSFGRGNEDKVIRINLGKFLENGFGKGIIRATVLFDSVHVIKPLQESGQYLYSGKLAAHQTVIFYSSTDSTFTPVHDVTIEFYSIKQEKSIGTDTLCVWAVVLGDMEIVE